MITELKCYWKVYRFFKSIKKTHCWFGMVNPLFGGKTPNYMIAVGRSKKLLKIIKDQLEQNGPPEPEPEDDLINWHWPFLRINGSGAREYLCPHGVGHGGTHGCCGCCGHESYERMTKKKKRKRKSK